MDFSGWQVPLSCQAAKHEQVPQQQSLASRRMTQTGGDSWRMRRRGDAPVSAGNPARERQYGVRRGAERRPDKGRYCTSEFGQLVCFSSTPTAWARTFLGGLTGSILSGLEPASERGASTIYRTRLQNRAIPCIVLRGGASE